MTTIAYKDGVMAADSGVWDNGRLVTEAVKIIRLRSGGLFGAAGDSDHRGIVKLVGGIRSPARLPSKKDLEETREEVNAILVLPGGEVFAVFNALEGMSGNHSEWRGGIECIHEGMYAVGSGGDIAMGALAVGASLVEAVWAACRYDCYTRPPVRSVGLHESEEDEE